MKYFRLILLHMLLGLLRCASKQKKGEGPFCCVFSSSLPLQCQWHVEKSVGGVSSPAQRPFCFVIDRADPPRHLLIDLDVYKFNESLR